jgi:hypothetical protein
VVVVEVKANGSQVVAPPSDVRGSSVEKGFKHTGEDTCEWVHSPDDTTIAVCPGWLLQEL